MPNPKYETMREPIADLNDAVPKEFDKGGGEVVDINEFRANVAKAKGRVTEQVTESAAARAIRLQAERDAAEMHRSAIANTQVRDTDEVRRPSDYFPGGFKVDAATGAEDLMTRPQMNRADKNTKKGGFLSNFFRRPK